MLTLVLPRFLQNQFQLVYSQQQTPIANSSNYFPKNEISNVMLEQFKEIVFNQSSSKSSNNDVMTNSSIPIVVGIVSTNGTQVSGLGNISSSRIFSAGPEVSGLSSADPTFF